MEAVSNVVDRLKSSAPVALRDTSALSAYLYGSRATGRTHAESDVDVAVWLAGGLSRDRTDTVLDLTARLADVSGLGNIEVSVLNWAPLRITGRVLSEGILLFSRDDPARIVWESRMLREFWDFRIRADEVDRQALREWPKESAELNKGPGCPEPLLVSGGSYLRITRWPSQRPKGSSP